MYFSRAATNIVPCALTGGESRKSEKARLRKGVNIVLGTPGRLIDHLEKSESLKNLDKLEFIVLDEVKIWKIGIGLEEALSMRHF